MELSSAVFRHWHLGQKQLTCITRHYAEITPSPARIFWNLESDEVFRFSKFWIRNPNLFQKVLNFLRFCLRYRQKLQISGMSRFHIDRHPSLPPHIPKHLWTNSGLNLVRAPFFIPGLLFIPGLFPSLLPSFLRSTQKGNKHLPTVHFQLQKCEFPEDIIYNYHWSILSWLILTVDGSEIPNNHLGWCYNPMKFVTVATSTGATRH